MTDNVSSGNTPEKLGENLYPCIALGALSVVLIWGYWNSLTEASIYWKGAQYSHGFLVPVFTAMLLWFRRKSLSDGSFADDKWERNVLSLGLGLAGLGLLVPWMLGTDGSASLKAMATWLFPAGVLVLVIGATLVWLQDQPATRIPVRQRWWGVGLLAFGLLSRLLCAQFALDIPDMVTFIPSLAGLFLLAGGWPMLRWAGPAVVFLVFMFPLPWSLETALLNPLQLFATKLSTYALQTMGIGAFSEGNVIRIGELKMGVVDACSGLRMLTIFIALSAALAMIVDRPWWERLVILFSAIPIALAVNVTRITVTGVLHLTTSEEVANKVFHDLAGLVMMPMALGLLWLELVILSHLFREVEYEHPAASFGGG